MMIPIINNCNQPFDNPTNSSIFEVNINNDEQINHFGYLSFDLESGVWALKGTPEGAQCRQGLSVLLKTATQFYNQQSSDYVNLSKDMQFGFLDQYVFGVDFKRSRRQ